MARRFTKEISRELIKFVKHVDISLNLKHADTVGAYEFTRQMSSPHFKVINPTYELKFESHLRNDKAIVKAELADGSKWEKVISGMKASEIRSDFFSNVETVSDNMELEGEDKGDDESTASAGKGKAGSKSASSKGGAKK